MAPQISGIRTIGVPVVDQDKALEFYVGTLGLEKRLDVAMGPGMRWLELGPTGAEITVALIKAGDELPAGIETGIRFVTSDAEAAHADLGGNGVVVGELLRWPGVPPMFTFRDPDGNGFELVESGLGT
jgi:catechol 2,3-dioxygenase-like lactoylglutathione lyase family enzyme